MQKLWYGNVNQRCLSPVLTSAVLMVLPWWSLWLEAVCLEAADEMMAVVELAQEPLVLWREALFVWPIPLATHQSAGQTSNLWSCGIFVINICLDVYRVKQFMFERRCWRLEVAMQITDSHTLAASMLFSKQNTPKVIFGNSIARRV